MFDHIKELLDQFGIKTRIAYIILYSKGSKLSLYYQIQVGVPFVNSIIES